MKRIGFTTFLATLIASTLAASATVLTFDNILPAPQVESGYSYLNNSSYNTGGIAYLHDDIGGQNNIGFQRVGGGQFTAVSVDMYGYQNLYQAGVAPPPRRTTGPVISQPDQKITFNNYQWNGYRNGVLVASNTGAITGSLWQNYTFDPTFSGLTTLELLLLGPKAAYTYVLGGFPVPAPGSFYCENWCTGVMIDNLNLNEAIAAVPLPAGLLLLGSALGAGALVGRRRRRHA